jgi:hypothetical protein
MYNACFDARDRLPSLLITWPATDGCINTAAAKHTSTHAMRR